MPTFMRTFPAVLLYLNGVIYLWVGWLFINDPQTWLEALGISLRSDLGLTDLRAVYGGFLAGFGVFLLLTGWKSDWTGPGVWLLVLTYAGLVAARSWGVLVEGEYNALVMQVYIAEWVSLVLSILAMFCLHRR
ncbi:MAG: DUF4345 family protein [Gammaproteobacteria bacterium]|nr:DUF4345 family protein [Gammaproteobacteria bacterium]MDP2140805.1 DUF4345 family protein [Gammaproteobacteria bacterium]MDP2347551.1 DUF4345 family protein [Gammaproteobacteria bacterium]